MVKKESDNFCACCLDNTTRPSKKLDWNNLLVYILNKIFQSSRLEWPTQKITGCLYKAFLSKQSIDRFWQALGDIARAKKACPVSSLSKVKSKENQLENRALIPRFAQNFSPSFTKVTHKTSWCNLASFPTCSQAWCLCWTFLVGFQETIGFRDQT